MRNQQARVFRRSVLMLTVVAMAGLAVLVWTGWLSLGTHSSEEAVSSADESVPAMGVPSELSSEERSLAIDTIFTSQKQMALTFNGLADMETMTSLLHELDKHDIRATFFLPGMRVAEEPDLVEKIVQAGHEIANNTLDQQDMSEWPIADIYEDLRLTNELIEREVGIQPRYVRSRSGDYTDDLRRAAEALGMEAVVGYSINPRDRDGKSAAEIGAYVDRYMRRGAVVLLHTNLNPEIVDAIAYIADAATHKGYSFVPIGQLRENGTVYKPLEEIPGFDAAQMNPDYADRTYTLIESIPNGKKEIAMTFDDWGSEDTINAVLDILDDYDLKCTFFLVGEGVEKNPNLARAILDDGHEIANHTYSHKVVTTLSPKELQEEVVKGHQALTEALQEPPLMIFRPPTGVFDDTAARIIAATGYQMIVNYDVDPMDWDAAHSAEDITNTILEQTVDGSIILLHILDDKHTIEALPNVIEGLQAEGYSFVKVTELMEYMSGNERILEQ